MYGLAITNGAIESGSRKGKQVYAVVYKRSNIKMARRIAGWIEELRAPRTYPSRGATPGNSAESDDSAQQLRFRGFLMAAATSLMVIFLLALCWWEEVLMTRPFVLVSIAILVCILVFYGLFRSGLNKKLRDPSLNVPMIISSISVISYALYYLNGARGVFLLVYLVSMLFGVFRLDTRKLLAISVYVLCSYGAVIWLLMRYAPNTVHLQLEMLQWMVLASVLIWFSFMGGYIRKLRKTAGEALRKSEAHFRSVAESANDAIISADRLGHIVFWNAAARKIFGYAQEEVLGRPLIMLMPERYREAHLRGIQHFLTTGEARVSGKLVELAALHKDGTEFPIDLSLATWHSREETFFTAIVRDTTERKRTFSQRLAAIGRRSPDRFALYKGQPLAQVQAHLTVVTRTVFLPARAFRRPVLGRKALGQSGRHIGRRHRYRVGRRAHAT
jgi:PAS domain S-box-containing protein